MTFSLVARCAETGMFGMVISSSSPAVAARCAHARAGVGVVASQNVTDPALGPRVLDLMAQGIAAPEAVARVREASPFMEYRQILAVDATGATAVHSGENALGLWSSAQGQDAAAGGNLLAQEGVPQAMLDGFLATSGHLGDRLIAALAAGLDAGGEAGPVHSAGLLLVDRLSWPLAELRCDWTEACPIAAVTEAWAVYRPQMGAYVQRALDPRAAPSYGVPGDD
ncbi:DUF1028 domain-containing protein [Salipiger marinus]|uniref:DUF1028 domain-containing protein n=1 Tax=Salipiger marinus TaxID=555512 RepID=UPI001E3056BF|nr:DUF1028 domain-containing protein [Salipiger manganoxidans]MCD1618759.1 DUF1028 domain-containing protein [Salipiger manganoxidans]MEB3417801.1 DUF1028 domain-containing protein [Salipiger manganoxidans]